MRTVKHESLKQMGQTMATHTQAEWVLKENEPFCVMLDNGDAFVTQDFDVCVKDTNRPIARVVFRSGANGDFEPLGDHREVKANAKLIAAAPYMLLALEIVVDFLKDREKEIARQAIAKAKSD